MTAGVVGYIHLVIRPYIRIYHIIERSKRKMKMMSLKIPNDLHFKFKRMAMERETTMSEIIMGFIKEELGDHEEVRLRCGECDTVMSVAELRKTDFDCPECGKRVRSMRPGR